MNTTWSELLCWYLSKRSGRLKRGSNGTLLVDLISQFLLHLTIAIITNNKNQGNIKVISTNFSILKLQRLDLQRQ